MRFILFVLIIVSVAFSANFFIRSDGVATKANATGPYTDVNACMTVTTHNAATYSAGDNVYIYGVNRLTALNPPSTGVNYKNIGGMAEINGSKLLTSATYRWIKSSSGRNEYYCELAAGGNPSIASPSYMWINDQRCLVDGTLGNLDQHKGKYGDNDGLGFSTIYVRFEEGDPDVVTGIKVEVSATNYAWTHTSTNIANCTFDSILFNKTTSYVGYLSTACTSFVFKNCRFEKGSDMFQMTNPMRWKFHNCTFAESHGANYGVYVIGTSTDSILFNYCVVKETYSNGFYFNTTVATVYDIINCSIYGTGSTAVRIPTGNTDAEVNISNTAIINHGWRSSSTYGIQASSGTVDVAHSYYTDNWVSPASGGGVTGTIDSTGNIYGGFSRIVSHKIKNAPFAITFDDRTSLAYADTLAKVCNANGVYLTVALPNTNQFSAAEWDTANVFVSNGNEISNHTQDHAMLNVMTACTLQYVGAGTAATVTIDSVNKTLVTSITDASGDNLNISLTNASYNTTTELIAYLEGLAAYTCGKTEAYNDAVQTSLLFGVSGSSIMSKLPLGYDSTRFYDYQIAGNAKYLDDSITVAGYTCRTILWPYGRHDDSVDVFSRKLGVIGARDVSPMISEFPYVDIYDIPSWGISDIYSATEATMKRRCAAVLEGSAYTGYGACLQHGWTGTSKAGSIIFTEYADTAQELGYCKATTFALLSDTIRSWGTPYRTNIDTGRFYFINNRNYLDLRLLSASPLASAGDTGKLKRDLGLILNMNGDTIVRADGSLKTTSVNIGAYGTYNASPPPDSFTIDTTWYLGGAASGTVIVLPSRLKFEENEPCSVVAIPSSGYRCDSIIYQGDGIIGETKITNDTLALTMTENISASVYFSLIPVVDTNTYDTINRWSDLLFQDYFETGTYHRWAQIGAVDVWDWNKLDTVNVTDSIKKGRYALKVKYDGKCNALFDDDYTNTTNRSHDTVFERFEIYLGSDFSLTTNSEVVIGSVANTTQGNQAYLLIRNVAGSYVLRGFSFSGLNTNGTTTINKEQWYTVEFMYDNTNNRFAAWLNGSVEINQTPSFSYPVHKISIGSEDYLSSWSGTMFFDNVIAAKDSIGYQKEIKLIYPDFRSRVSANVTAIFLEEDVGDYAIIKIDGTAIDTLSSPLNGVGYFNVNINSLSSGNHILRAVLYNSSDDSLTKTDYKFYKEYSSTPAFTIDSLNNIIIDGNRKILATSFSSTLGGIRTVAVDSNAVNIMMGGSFSNTDVGRYLDSCNLFDIKFMGPALLNNWYSSVPNDTIDSLISRHSSDPAMAAWIFQEEPDNWGSDPLETKEWWDTIKKQDPIHPHEIILMGYSYFDSNWPSTRRYHWPTWSGDIYGFDVYPIAHWDDVGEDHFGITEYVNCVDAAIQWNHFKIPVIPFIQSSNCNTGSSSWLPTDSMVINMSWLAIVHGAKGVHWYPYPIDGTVCEDPDYVDYRYIGMRNFKIQMDSLSKYICSDSATGFTITDNANDSGSRVDFMCRKDGDTTYVFAARLSEPNEINTVSATFTTNQTYRVDKLNLGTWEYSEHDANSSTFSSAFTPNDVQIFKLYTDETPTEPPVITVDPVSVTDTINRDTTLFAAATGATSWQCQIWSDGSWTDTVANDSARVALTQSRDGDSIRFIASNTGGDDTSTAALITVLADTSAYFNVVVLPDMHIETALNYQYAKSQAQWIIANKTVQNIKYVVTVGDMVTNAKTRQEWLWADSIFDMLDTAKVPYAIATGNHDYDSLGIRRLDSMALYFPKTRLSNNFWWNGKFCDSSKICESGVNTFTAYGNAYGVMTIEAFPRDTITAWAKEYLDTSSNYYNILSTHSYLDSNNTITSADVTVLTGEDMGDSIWKKLRTTDINFIVSGDIGGKLNSSGFRVNYTKQKTYCNQFNNDYQLEGTSNGGLGYLRIYKFKPIANRIEVRTYSPYLNLYSKTDYRDNFATYMFTPDSIGKLPNKYIKHALLPTAAKLGYNPDSTTGNFTVDNTAGNKYLIYRGPRNDTDITVTGANLTYANGKLKFNNSSTYITSPTYRLRFGQHDSLNISQLVVAQVKWTAAKDLFGDQGTGGFGGLQFYQSITPKRFRVLMQPTATTGGYAISKSVNPGATDTVQLGYEIDGGAPHVYYNGALHDSLTKNITHDTTVASALYGFCDIAYFDTAIIAAVLFDTSIEATGFSGIYSSGGSFGGLKLFDNNFLVDSTFYKIDDLDIVSDGASHRRWWSWRAFSNWR